MRDEGGRVQRIVGSPSTQGFVTSKLNSFFFPRSMVALSGD